MPRTLQEALDASGGILALIPIARNEVHVAVHHPLISHSAGIDDDIVPCRTELLIQQFPARKKHPGEENQLFRHRVEYPGVMAERDDEQVTACGGESIPPCIP